MSNVDIKFFLNNSGRDNKLGGGYITIANLVKTSFTLIKTKTGGYFVSFPSYQDKDGNWKNHVDTVNKEAREYITNEVVRAYQSATGGYSPTGNSEDRRVEQPKDVVTEATPSGNNVPKGRPF